MYRLDIVLGASIFEKWFPRDKIEQHRVILSHNIINYYINSAKNDQARNAAKDFIGCIGNDNNKHLQLNLKSIVCNPQEEMIEIASTIPYHIIIADPTEFVDYQSQLVDKHISITTISDIESEDSKLPFNKFTCTITMNPRKGDSCNDILTWLGRIFEGESTFDIVDPYIMSDSNLDSFIRSILPIIPRNSTINIYTDIDHVSNQSIAIATLREKNKFNHSIIVNWCNHSYMHDRFIKLSGIEINISNSLIALTKDERLFRDITITVKNKSKTFRLLPPASFSETV